MLLLLLYSCSLVIAWYKYSNARDTNTRLLWLEMRGASIHSQNRSCSASVYVNPYIPTEIGEED